MKKQELIARALKQLPYIDKAEPELESDPGAMLDKVRPPEEGGGEEGLGLESVGDGGGRNRRVELLERGTEALKKVRRSGARARLSDDEMLGLEAVILVTGRPALLVQDNTFPTPPPGWEVLEEHRKEIENTFPSVGAIFASFDGGGSQQIGTAFVVGKNTLMTNRHVAVTFAQQDDDGWAFKPGLGAKIDYRREKDRDARREFAVKSIIGVHAKLDMALLEVKPKAVSGTAKLPPPLTLAAKAPKKGDHVYTVGYPVRDNTGATPSPVLLDIFGDVLGVKRLQPGEYDGALQPPSIFSHDCSTLAGNSGSCVLSLATHEVVGLHYQGTFEVTNRAVSLWKLKNDALLKGRVEFAA